MDGDLVMVINSVTSLTNNGLRDWLIQRVSALVLIGYMLFLCIYIFSQPQLDYATWYNLFSHQWMKVISALVLLNLILHSWVGVWTVTTDYLNCFYIRIFIQIAVILALFGYFIWGLAILWSF